MNRRKFLHHAGASAIAMPLWMRLCGMKAEAQTTGGYKAILSISLVGGNDANNLIVPMDTATYQSYASIRGYLALPQAAILPLNTSSGTYGLHPSMTNLQARFAAGQASIIANVGPLRQPTTKQNLGDVNLSAARLSHPGGRQAWESGLSQGGSPIGSGGQFGDYTLSASGTLPPVISVSGDSTFTLGNTGKRMTVASASSTAVQPLPSDLVDIIESIAAGDMTSQHAIVSAAAQLRSNANTQQQIVTAAQASSNLKTVFPTTSLGQSLLAIAKVIAGRNVVGASRQVFYAAHNGYDTHAEQLPIQASLLTDLDGAIGAFLNAMDELGLSNDVLVCTLSDFGRSLQGNPQGGTDHGWGTHQMVFGGGIHGGRVMGSMPMLQLGGADDVLGFGVWLPTLAASQMTAGIANWFGLSPTQIQTIFPELVNFSAGALVL